ncbi:hypothetical protein PUN4_1550006 [Paraburkholderia unamae]|nr:hypothetical protein PUN4_1550006 [Paraburkholderia unamae]
MKCRGARREACFPPKKKNPQRCGFFFVHNKALAGVSALPFCIAHATHRGVATCHTRWGAP